MKLKINDNYIITSDTHCYILNKILFNKKTNEEYLQPIGFYKSLDDLILGLINREIRTHDLECINEIISHISAIKDEILSEVRKHEINRRIYENMVDEIYDSLLGKEGEYIIYVSRAMYSYIKMIQSYKMIANNYVPRILGFPLLFKEELNGNEYEAVRK